MLSLTQFETFPTDAQADYTWLHGTYLMSQLTGSLLINLYSVADFYVEISCDTQLHYLHRVSCFKQTHALDAYLETVFLQGLLNDPLPASSPKSRLHEVSLN